MVNVAFATYRDLPGFVADEVATVEELRRSGVSVTPVVWDDPSADWAGFDSVLIRSTWDYHHKADQFESWVRAVARAGPRLWNPPEAVLWNVNKRYLLDLADRGVEVVPTEYLTANARPDLRPILARMGWDDAVVKPAVGAGAHGAWRTSRASPDQARLAEQLAQQDILLQSWMPEIASGGEWSLVFFGLEYSHAVRKWPGPGDFRVQEHLGGKTQRAEPSPALIDQARAAIVAVGQTLLYARVDGVERDGHLVLMELEIIEPFLFLAHGSGTAHRFADAIRRAVLRPSVG